MAAPHPTVASLMGAPCFLHNSYLLPLSGGSNKAPVCRTASEAPPLEALCAQIDESERVKTHTETTRLLESASDATVRTLFAALSHPSALLSPPLPLLLGARPRVAHGAQPVLSRASAARRCRSHLL